jgi:hypothetical protein
MTRSLAVALLSVAFAFVGAGHASADASSYLDRVQPEFEEIGVSFGPDALLSMGYTVCEVAAEGGDTGDARVAVEQRNGALPEGGSSVIVLKALAFLCPEYGRLLGQ